MKPTNDDVLKWAREVGFEVTVTATIRPYLESVAALAYAAGAKAMQERCAKVCEVGVDMQHPTIKGHTMKNFEKSRLLAEAIRALGDDE